MPPTPFMGLTLPTVSVTLGPTWATEVNAAFNTIDSHNHTTGQGVPIPTAGITVNADFPLNSFNLTLARSLIMNNNPSPLSLVTDITSLYASGGNLYYNNAVGNQIRITVGAGLDASSVGGFGGDYGSSTATAFYTSATSTFTFWQDLNIPALMDFGPITIHPVSSATNGISIIAPNTLSSSYQLTLPNSLPGSGTKILTVDSSGVINDAYDVDGSTIEVVSNTLQVTPGGIGDTQIAVGGVAWNNLALRPGNNGGSGVSSDGSPAFLAIDGVITSGSEQAIGGTIQVTSLGSPIMLMIVPQNAGSLPTGGGTLTLGESNGSSLFIAIKNQTTGAYITSSKFQLINGSFTQPETSIPATIVGIDFVGAGTYTYQVVAQVSGTFFTNCFLHLAYLVGYEL